MSSNDEFMSGDEDEPVSLKTFMKNMSKELAKINNNISSMQDDVRDTVAVALEPITARLDSNSRRMDKLENTQRNNMEDMKQRLDEVIRKKKVEKAGNGQIPGSYANAIASGKENAFRGNDLGNKINQ